jgi:hypothetical protein
MCTAVTKYCLVFIFLFGGHFFGMSQEWKKSVDKNGIIVYTRPNKITNILDTKAAMEVNCSFEKMLQTLMNFEKFPEWVPQCLSNKIVRKYSDSEFIYYSIIRVPYLKNRDMVVHFKLRKINTALWIIDVKNDDNHVPLDKRYERIPYYIGRYYLSSKEKGKTSIVLESALDPGVKLPDFLINMAITDNPYNMFKNLKKILQS